jgi:hypothetical protein
MPGPLSVRGIGSRIYIQARVSGVYRGDPGQTAAAICPDLEGAILFLRLRDLAVGSHRSVWWY